jgi:electron-transferring-flavoprotein dehydrogenase
MRRYLEGGKRIAYGARAVNKGGVQSLPKLTFPGGMLIGCAAGFLNGVKIKGAHTAIKTGMLAAESVQKALAKGDAAAAELSDFEESVKASWAYKELYKGRNFGPGLHKLGTFWGAAFTFIDQNIFFGKLPFTWRNREPDHESLTKASEAKVIEYPKPDGKLTFDRLSSVFLSSTNHEEDQPSHSIVLQSPGIRRAGSTLLPGWCIRNRGRGRREEISDQRGKLCSLQNLRHQGPQAKHRLDSS